MPAITFPEASDVSRSMLHSVRAAILLCAFSVGACAGLPARDVTPELISANHAASDHAIARLSGQGSGNVWWKLYSW